VHSRFVSNPFYNQERTKKNPSPSRCEPEPASRTGERAPNRFVDLGTRPGLQSPLSRPFSARFPLLPFRVLCSAVLSHFLLINYYTFFFLFVFCAARLASASTSLPLSRPRPSHLLSPRARAPPRRRRRSGRRRSPRLRSPEVSPIPSPAASPLAPSLSIASGFPGFPGAPAAAPPLIFACWFAAGQSYTRRGGRTPADEVYIRVPIRLPASAAVAGAGWMANGTVASGADWLRHDGGLLVPVRWIGVSSGTRWTVACLSSWFQHIRCVQSSLIVGL